MDRITPTAAAATITSTTADRCRRGGLAPTTVRQEGRVGGEGRLDVCPYRLGKLVRVAGERGCG